MSFRFMGARVEIARTSSPWPAADTVLLPTNDYLWMATGSALEVRRIAGEAVELEAVRAGPISIGEVVVTGPGELALEGIIHMAVMGQDLLVDETAAEAGLRRGLATARERGWGRVLIHSFLGTGRGTHPHLSGRILGALVEELLEREGLRELTLLARDEAEATILREGMLRIIQSHG